MDCSPYECGAHASCEITGGLEECACDEGYENGGEFGEDCEGNFGRHHEQIMTSWDVNTFGITLCEGNPPFNSVFSPQQTII